jgi:TATA-binding protein-associated factor Taf7
MLKSRSKGDTIMATTVKKLIEELKKYHPDAPVSITLLDRSDVEEAMEEEGVPNPGLLDADIMTILFLAENLSETGTPTSEELAEVAREYVEEKAKEADDEDFENP